jgi:hypothetical protein
MHSNVLSIRTALHRNQGQFASFFAPYYCYAISIISPTRVCCRNRPRLAGVRQILRLSLAGQRSSCLARSWRRGEADLVAAGEAHAQKTESSSLSPTSERGRSAPPKPQRFSPEGAARITTIYSNGAKSRWNRHRVTPHVLSCVSRIS